MKGPGSRILLRALVVLVPLALGLAPASAAAASPLFVWHGKGPYNWSEPANWQGAHAPAPADGAVNLEFPLSDCSQAPRLCDATTDDIAGLTLNTLTLAGISVSFPLPGPHELPPAEPRPAAYSVQGTKPLKLAGGIEADIGDEGTGIDGEGATVAVDTPLELTAANTWTVGPGAGGALQIAGSLTGRHPLNVTLLGADSLELPAEVETGPIDIAGVPGVPARVSIGSGSEINAGDAEPIRLQDATLEGSGAIGPLKLESAAVRVGEVSPGGDLRVEGDFALEGRSEFDIGVPGSDPKRTHRLIVQGSAELGGAALKISEGCPTVGETYTLLEADEGVTGRFTAPDGQTIEDGQTIGGETGGCANGSAAPPLLLEYGPRAVSVTALAAMPPPAGSPVAPAGGPPAYSAAARAVLASDLKWLGAGRRIGPVLAGRGEAVAMKAPRPGVFTIQWRLRRGGRDLVIATGRLMLPTGGTGQLLILLTRDGRRVLRHARRLRLTVLQSFTSAGLPADVTQTTLLLRR